MEKNRRQTYEMVLVGLFAAVTFLGIQSFRIPLPAAVGVPFLHFGNIFLLLGALLLGARKGALAGAIGFALFDVLNGYITVMPKVIIIAVLMCYAASKLFDKYQNKLGTYMAVILASAAAFLISLTGDFLYDTGLMLFAGSGAAAAMWAAFTSLLATAVNSVFGIVATTLIYPVLKPIVKRA